MRRLFLIAIILSGCAQPTSPREPAFSDLVRQVRLQESTEIITTDEPIGDEELALLAGLAGLKHLAIENFQGTAQGLKVLVELPDLQRLQLRGGKVQDDVLAVLASCEGLKNLNLPDARSGNAGLAELKSLSVLELLRFHSPNVTDEGMAEIAAIKSLRFLHLIRVPITDQGLRHLEAMTQLESFYVDDADVTDEGIERLLKAIPGLHLHVNQQHSDRDPSKGTHPH